MTRQPIADAFFMIIGVPLLLLATLLVLIIFAPLAVWDKLTGRQARGQAKAS